MGARRPIFGSWTERAGKTTKARVLSNSSAPMTALPRIGLTATETSKCAGAPVIAGD